MHKCTEFANVKLHLHKVTCTLHTVHTHVLVHMPPVMNARKLHHTHVRILETRPMAGPEPWEASRSLEERKAKISSGLGTWSPGSSPSLTPLSLLDFRK